MSTIKKLVIRSKAATPEATRAAIHVRPSASSGASTERGLYSIKNVDKILHAVARPENDTATASAKDMKEVHKYLQLLRSESTNQRQLALACIRSLCEQAVRCGSPGSALPAGSWCCSNLLDVVGDTEFAAQNLLLMVRLVLDKSPSVSSEALQLLHVLIDASPEVQWAVVAECCGASTKLLPLDCYYGAQTLVGIGRLEDGDAEGEDGAQPKTDSLKDVLTAVPETLGEINSAVKCDLVRAMFWLELPPVLVERILTSEEVPLGNHDLCCIVQMLSTLSLHAPDATEVVWSLLPPKAVDALLKLIAVPSGHEANAVYILDVVLRFFFVSVKCETVAKRLWSSAEFASRIVGLLRSAVGSHGATPMPPSFSNDDVSRANLILIVMCILHASLRWGPDALPALAADQRSSIVDAVVHIPLSDTTHGGAVSMISQMSRSLLVHLKSISPQEDDASIAVAENNVHPFLTEARVSQWGLHQYATQLSKKEIFTDLETFQTALDTGITMVRDGPFQAFPNASTNPIATSGLVVLSPNNLTWWPSLVQYAPTMLEAAAARLQLGDGSGDGDADACFHLVTTFTPLLSSALHIHRSGTARQRRVLRFLVQHEVSILVTALRVAIGHGLEFTFARQLAYALTLWLLPHETETMRFLMSVLFPAKSYPHLSAYFTSTIPPEHPHTHGQQYVGYRAGALEPQLEWHWLPVMDQSLHSPKKGARHPVVVEYARWIDDNVAVAFRCHGSAYRTLIFLLQSTLRWTCDLHEPFMPLYTTLLHRMRIDGATLENVSRNTLQTLCDQIQSLDDLEDHKVLCDVIFSMLDLVPSVHLHALLPCLVALPYMRVGSLLPAVSDETCAAVAWDSETVEKVITALRNVPLKCRAYGVGQWMLTRARQATARRDATGFHWDVLRKECDML